MLLDERVESVTPRTTAMFAARPVVALASAILVALSLSLWWSVIWISCVVISEVWTWRATQPQRSRRPATLSERRFYYASIMFMNLVWCGLGALLWLQPGPAFKLAATCLLCAQIFHAQAFTAQSPAMLFVVGGFPAATLLGLPLVAGDFSLIDRVLVVGASIILVAYTASAAMVNARRDRQLEAAKNEAVAMREAQSRFLSIVSHEIRTPMTGLIGMAEALKVGDLSVDQADQIDVIINSGQMMMGLLDDLLDLSRLDAGAFTFIKSRFDPRVLAKTVETIWRPSATGKDLSFTVSVEPNLPSALLGDARRISQIVNNLVGNAIKFTSHGSILVRFDWAGGRLTVTVTDTGPGLSDSDAGILFQPFARVEDPHAEEKPDGTGLGLYISRKLANAMDGELAVRSAVGKGAQFILRLPLDVAPSASDSVADQRSLTVPRALIVEDHPVNQKIAETLLRAMGFDVLIAEDGERALEAARSSDFHVVLMDLRLPGINGVRTTRLMREANLIPDSVPVIAMTADLEAHQEMSAFAATIEKPLSAKSLAAAIEQATLT